MFKNLSKNNDQYLHNRMLSLMEGEKIQSDSKTELYSKSKAGKNFMIISEKGKYYIKESFIKDSLISEDYEYYGGFNNREKFSFDTYNKAVKGLNEILATENRKLLKLKSKKKPKPELDGEFEADTEDFGGEEITDDPIDGGVEDSEDSFDFADDGTEDELPEDGVDSSEEGDGAVKEIQSLTGSLQGAIDKATKEELNDNTVKSMYNTISSAIGPDNTVTPEAMSNIKTKIDKELNEGINSLKDLFDFE